MSLINIRNLYYSILYYIQYYTILYSLHDYLQIVKHYYSILHYYYNIATLPKK